MKKTIITILIVALVAVFINDVGRYARARYDLSVVGKDTADTMAMRPKETGRDTMASAAAALAASHGVTVYLYDQDEQQVHVWVEMPVQGTWLWARVAAYQSGEAQGSPFMIRTDYSSFWK